MGSNINRRSIAFIGEGETEFHYINQLRSAERLHIKIEPGLPQHSSLDAIVALAERMLARGYDLVVCMIDMDEVYANKTIFNKYRRIRSQYRRNERLLFLETNPCTEYWFLQYFLTRPSSKYYRSYDALLPDLKKHIPDYEKTERYFKRVNIYRYLNSHGDQQRACTNASSIDEKLDDDERPDASYTQLYRIMDEIFKAK